MARIQTMLCAVLIAIVAFGPAGAAQFKVIYTFKGGSDGASPYGVILDHRVLYGTTYLGGDTGCYKHLGCGTAFKLTPDGTKTTLALFGPQRRNGKSPRAPLTRSDDGNFFGTTDFGGKHNRGAVFELTPDGTVTIVHSFTWGLDGASPQQAALLADRKGNLYGTDPSGPYGAVFKIKADGSETVLHLFGDRADGAIPYGTLLRDKSGNLFGTASFGGTNCENISGCGVIFKVASDGTYSVLYSFDYNAYEPWGGLVADDNGNLYGTTSKGGDPNYCTNTFGCGTVFKFAADGTFSILYAFHDDGDGAFPYSGLIRDADGNLYGTTNGEIMDDTFQLYGSVFEVSPQGVETTLHSFQGGTDGSNPTTDLVSDGRGHLYGAADGGDKKCQCGVIFEITP